MTLKEEKALFSFLARDLGLTRGAKVLFQDSYVFRGQSPVKI